MSNKYISDNKINDMERAIVQVLKAGKRFYDIFGSTYSSGVIGELLVIKRILERYKKELASNKNCEIKFEGKCIQHYDIFFVLKGSKFEINAKATMESDKNKRPKWVRQHAKDYTNIKNEDKKTLCSPRTDYNKTLFYIFVDVKKWLEKSKADFYILSDSNAKKTFGKKYSKQQNSKPIRQNESDDMWIEYKDIKKYKDNNFKRFKKESHLN